MGHGRYHPIIFFSFVSLMIQMNLISNAVTLSCLQDFHFASQLSLSIVAFQQNIALGYRF